MSQKRVARTVLSILVIPFIGAILGLADIPYTGSSSGNKVLAQPSETTPTEPEQPAEAPTEPEQPAETPAEPAAESPEAPAEPAAPAEAAKPASETNWLLIGGGIVAALVVIVLLSSLSRRPRE